MTIRQKLFSILGLSQLIIISALGISFYILIDAVKDEPQNNRAIELSNAFKKELHDREEFLKIILKETVSNPVRLEFLNAGLLNREIFKQDSAYYNKIKKEYKIDIMEIGDQAGKVVYRYHRPNDFGDDKSHQKIIQEALAGKITSTLELGHSGLGLRATGPIYRSGTVLLGQKVDRDFMAGITGRWQVKLAVMENNKILASSDDAVMQFLQERKNLNSMNSGERVKFEGRHFYLIKIPYESAGLSNRNLSFAVMIDETEVHTASAKIWRIFGIAALLFFSSVFYVSYLFSKNIINAIRQLNSAMSNLDDEKFQPNVDTFRKDELGEIGKVFLSMKDEILNYQKHLEKLVDEKTIELKNSLEEIQKLKEHQDGDYFLTSLLLKPLNQSDTVYENINIDTIIRQKKRFTFRNREAEIGGDLCAADLISLEGRDFAAFINADAMGKSIQGAGGALVVGTVFKSFITRTKEEKNYSEKPPEIWLRDCHSELQKVFSSFDGSMILSAVIGLVDNLTGTLYCINAEHPWPVLYRDGQAQFLFQDTSSRKIGLSFYMDFEAPLKVHVFQMLPNDVIISGTDGRDDIIRSINNEKIMNEDEREFLRAVEKGDGRLENIEREILSLGEITDDLGLLRIEFKPEPEERIVNYSGQYFDLMREAVSDYRSGSLIEAEEKLAGILLYDPENLDMLRIYCKTLLKNRRYAKAVGFIETYLQKRPSDSKFLYYCSFCMKQTGRYTEAAEYGERYMLREPVDSTAAAELAEIYCLSENWESAGIMLEEAFRLDPSSIKAEKLRKQMFDKRLISV
ncbi:MAG TPA: SpoIIE family protein phosphatase [Leptospiraceae bacterium]|nr:SpoIIE family protein phosphatase [Leptospiraceae bacterium]HNF15715.1 SpoIIE family protein phosphatase [Leptospiraceae bacterium]HNF24846.1 SpoIIE family protein phosphatase [Leptospiraceae bacterium]HNM02572.1 SpoIIE family protein phosphatase [Leptospiraceae bacterium]